MLNRVLYRPYYYIKVITVESNTQTFLAERKQWGRILLERRLSANRGDKYIIF